MNDVANGEDASSGNESSNDDDSAASSDGSNSEDSSSDQENEDEEKKQVFPSRGWYAQMMNAEKNEEENKGGRSRNQRASKRVLL